MTLCIVGFDDLVTSFVATIATGWSDPCRVGLTPTEKPRLHAAHRAVPTTPADQASARVDCFPAHAAFPKWQEGRHPHCHFRGLLRLYSRYGPSNRSAAQRRPLSRGFDPASYPAESLVSFWTNRQLSRCNPPPLMIRAVRAHCQFPT